jgi:hypothetical protein
MEADVIKKPSLVPRYPPQIPQNLPGIELGSYGDRQEINPQSHVCEKHDMKRK